MKYEINGTPLPALTVYLENGECVSGEFPYSGKIHDNVEYCKDTQRFEFIEYFLKDEEE